MIYTEESVHPCPPEWFEIFNSFASIGTPSEKQKKIAHKIRRTGSSWLNHALLGDDAVYLVSTGWQWLVFRPHKGDTGTHWY